MYITTLWSHIGHFVQIRDLSLCMRKFGHLLVTFVSIQVSFVYIYIVTLVIYRSLCLAQSVWLYIGHFCLYISHFCPYIGRFCLYIGHFCLYMSHIGDSLVILSISVTMVTCWSFQSIHKSLWSYIGHFGHILVTLVIYWSFWLYVSDFCLYTGLFCLYIGLFCLYISSLWSHIGHFVYISHVGYILVILVHI